MNLIVIHEEDHDDGEQDVIGVVDSVEEADKLINDYYGHYELLLFTDIRDSSLEWSKRIKLSGIGNDYYEVTVTLQRFRLNKVR